MFLKPISLRTLFSLTSSSSPSFIAQLSTSSHSYLTYSHPQSHPDARNVRVLVWWDFENCNVPTGVNVFRVPQAITAAVRSTGIKGPIQIKAFGDTFQLARTNQDALSSTGINLTHIPHGGKNSADRSLLIDLMCWVLLNPPPAHLFLISGDRDFASILHCLRMRNYNILLASKESAPSVLSCSASIMWNWDALVTRENLTGRYFNHPPDGPFSSWYGHYQGPLEDPFPAVERPTCSQGENLTEVSSDPPVRPIPKAVRKQISNILTSKANGISITDLRQELLKSNVVIDKDLYGYKKFSRFLLSMPHILKLKAIGDGRFLVQGKFAGPVTNNGSHCITKSSVTNGENISPSGSACGVSSRPPSPRLNVEESQKIVQQPLEKPEQPPLEMHREQSLEKLEHLPIGGKAVKMNREQPPNKIELPPLLGEKTVEAVDAHATENRTLPLPEKGSMSDLGFSEKMRRLWFGSDYYSEIKKDIIPKESYSSGDSCEPLEKPEQPPLEMHREQPLEKLEHLPIGEKAVKMNREQPPNKIELPPLLGEKTVEAVDAHATENRALPLPEKGSMSDLGFSEKMRRLWFGSDYYSEIKKDIIPKESYSSGDSCEKKSENTMEKCDPSADIPLSKEVEKKCVKSQIQTDGAPLVKSCSKSTVASSVEHNSTSEGGTFDNLRRLWFGSDYCSLIKNDVTPKESFTSRDSFVKKSEGAVGKYVSGDNCQNVDPLDVKSCSNYTTTTMSSESDGEKPSKRPAFFNWIMNWCMLRRNDTKSVASDDQPSEVLQQMHSKSKTHEVFSQDSFWRDVQTFINTDRGSLIIAETRTRESMAHALQKEGPSVLRSVTKSDVLHLVDMLISQKKWVQESPSDTTPFKLTSSDAQGSSGLRSIFLSSQSDRQKLAECLTEKKIQASCDAQGSSGLRSIFLSSQSDTQKLAEYLTEKKIQASSDSGSSPAATNKSPSEKSRSEILGDCQTLVNEVLKKSPRGYSLTSFRKLFLQRFDYNIGYQKLSSLLQIMPGVKVESNFLIPSVQAGKHFKKDASLTSANSDSELSDASKRDDESDSPWEELGPVDDSGSHRKELQSTLRKKVQQEAKKCTYPDYESAFSDDDFSGSEEESSPETKQEGQMKPGKDDEDSSLLQILDSWYSSKDGSENAKRKPKASESKVGCADNDFGLSDSSEFLSKIETSSRTNARKQKPQKTYSFVDSSAGHEKGKLVDDIIGSLKKSTKPSVHG